jgi:hypothetical protein
MAVILALALAACGSASMTVAEYAEGAESLVAGMTADFAVLDAEWLSGDATAERAAVYWEGRLEIRYEFLAGVEALDPPEPVVEQHRAALDVFGRITAADEVLAEAVAAYPSIEDHWQWVDTPEGRAADAILEEIYGFCRASQADFDATAVGAALDEVPWVPSEMTEVVSVAFGCPPPPDDDQ